MWSYMDFNPLPVMLERPQRSEFEIISRVEVFEFVGDSLIAFRNIDISDREVKGNIKLLPIYEFRTQYSEYVKIEHPIFKRTLESSSHIDTHGS